MDDSEQFAESMFALERARQAQQKNEQTHDVQLEIVPCQCESNFCDHPNARCYREVQHFVRMAFVGECCTTCAANMCKYGGENYISLNK